MSTNEPESLPLSPEGQKNVGRLDQASGGSPAYLDDDFRVQEDILIKAGSRFHVASEGGRLWLYIWPPDGDTPTLKLLV